MACVSSLVFSERFDAPTQTWTIDRVVPQNGRYALAPWASVGPSTVPDAGDGVFAARRFRKGDTVGVYTGEIRTYSSSHDDRSDSLLALDRLFNDGEDLVVIDGDVGGNWTRKLNDGSVRCNPRWRKSRCNVKFVEDNKIVAIADIRKGEEMLIDYGDDYWATTSGTGPAARAGS